MTEELLKCDQCGGSGLVAMGDGVYVECGCPQSNERDDAIVLADAIVQAWEASDVTFAKDFEIHLALIAARFLVKVARPENSRAEIKPLSVKE